MIRAFQLLEQGPDAIERNARLQLAKVVGFDLKALEPWHRAALREARAQQIVDERLERLSRAPRFGLQARGDVIIQGQCGSHILML